MRSRKDRLAFKPSRDDRGSLNVRRRMRTCKHPPVSRPALCRAKFGCGRAADPSASWENINEGFGRDQFPAQSRTGEVSSVTGREGRVTHLSALPHL